MGEDARVGLHYSSCRDVLSVCPALELAKRDVQHHHYGEAKHRAHGGYIGTRVALCLRDQLLDHDKDHCPSGKRQCVGKYGSSDEYCRGANHSSDWLHYC